MRVRWRVGRRKGGVVANASGLEWAFVVPTFAVVMAWGYLNDVIGALRDWWREER